MCEGPSSISGPIPPDPSLFPQYYKRPASGGVQPRDCGVIIFFHTILYLDIAALRYELGGCDRRMATKVKREVYKIVMRPAVTCTLKMVALTKRQKAKFEGAQLKMFVY